MVGVYFFLEMYIYILYALCMLSLTIITFCLNALTPQILWNNLYPSQKHHLIYSDPSSPSPPPQM